MVNKSAEYAPILGSLINSYVDGWSQFEELEQYISEAVGVTGADLPLLDAVYHVLNHFDLDKHMRDSSPRYFNQTSNNLRVLANALTTGTREDAWQAARTCLGRR